MQWLDLKQTSGSETNLLAKYVDCKLLIIDDLGTRTPSEGFLDYFYLLINKRINKPSNATIVSTNMSSKEMAEKLGSAILSRIASGMIIKFPEQKDRRTHKF